MEIVVNKSLSEIFEYGVKEYFEFNVDTYE